MKIPFVTLRSPPAAGDEGSGEGSPPQILRLRLRVCEFIRFGPFLALDSYLIFGTTGLENQFIHKLSE